MFLFLSAFPLLPSSFRDEDHSKNTTFNKKGDHPSYSGRGRENRSVLFLAIYINSECSSPLSFIILLLFLFPSPYCSPERSLGLSHPPSSHFGRTQSLCKTASHHVLINALVPTEEHQEHSGVGQVLWVGCCSLPVPLLLIVCYQTPEK